jgi:hypothetical protein
MLGPSEYTGWLKWAQLLATRKELMSLVFLPSEPTFSVNVWLKLTGIPAGFTSSLEILYGDVMIDFSVENHEEDILVDELLQKQTRPRGSSTTTSAVF